MTFRIALSSFVDQTARDAAAAAQSTATAAQTSASNAAQQAATALINASTAQTAADNANTAAGSALSVASSRNHVLVQTTAPTTATVALTLDDLWIDPSNGNRVQSWDGSSWQPVAFGTLALAAASITADLIAAGAIGAGAIAADAIDGKTITGATFRTAAAGQRVQIDSANGLIGYDSAGDPVTQIRTSDGALVATGATVTGEINTAASGARVRVYEETVTSGTTTQNIGVTEFDDGYGGVYQVSSVATLVNQGNGAVAPYGSELDIGCIASNNPVNVLPGFKVVIEQAPAGGWRGAALVSVPLESTDRYAALTPTSPMANYGTGYLPLHVRKDAGGIVHCWGMLRNGGSTTLAGNLTLASGIPAAMRPSVVVANGFGYSSSGAIVRVDASNTGTLTMPAAGGDTIPAGGFLVVNLAWPGPDLDV